jgi:putative Mg2+ transporter-C (MgtC) family protein
MEQLWIEILEEINIEGLAEALVKLMLAIVCGGLLGLDRERKKRPAGLRTYMMVCIGATLVMMTNDYICDVYGTGDPSRLGAQVISGIGFLGAGTIITTGHNKVKGLTTAAGLWAVACIGLAIGVGFYAGALLGTALLFFSMTALNRLDRRIVATSRSITLYVELEELGVIKKLSDALKKQEIKMMDFETETKNPEKTAALISVRLPSKKVYPDLLGIVNAVDGVIAAVEV